MGDPPPTLERQKDPRRVNVHERPHDLPLVERYDGGERGGELGPGPRDAVENPLDEYDVPRSVKLEIVCTRHAGAEQHAARLVMLYWRKPSGPAYTPP